MVKQRIYNSEAEHVCEVNKRTAIKQTIQIRKHRLDSFKILK